MLCVLQKCMGLPQEPACSAVDVYSKMAAMTNGYVSPADAKAADDKDVSDVTQCVRIDRQRYVAVRVIV